AERQLKVALGFHVWLTVVTLCCGIPARVPAGGMRRPRRTVRVVRFVACRRARQREWRSAPSLPVSVADSAISSSFAFNAFGLADHPFEFFRALVCTVDLRHAGEQAQQTVGRDFDGVGAGDEPLGESAGGGGEAHGGAGLLQRGGVAGEGHFPRVL